MAIDILPNNVRNVVTTAIFNVTSELFPALTPKQLLKNVDMQLRAMTLEEAIDIYVAARKN